MKPVICGGYSQHDWDVLMGRYITPELLEFVNEDFAARESFLMCATIPDFMVL